MTGRALLAAAVLGTLASACTDPTPPAVTLGLRQPAALAVFRGLTLDDPGVRPYLAVANASRSDLTIIDATDDTAVLAPVQLRALTVPMPERPALLASASLGDLDDDPADPTDDKPDLLVAVSAGDSVLQVVTTWDPSNTVFSDPTPAPPEAPLAVDLGFDVLALAAVPSPAGTARIAAALADRRIAVVEYARGTDGASIVLVGSTVSAPLAFQPLALAAAPDGDPDPAVVLTAIYAATLDEIASGVFGVAEILPNAILQDPGVTPVRALGARGPTRLVAAARLRERAPTSSAMDASAFTGQPRVARVYAVLDESGCGLDRRIGCGVVTLAPEEPAGSDAIPDDWAGRMPYRAPIPIPGRPLALAVAQPPVVPTPGLPAEYGGEMRLAGGAVVVATTAVGAVASDDGKVYFLDLGRFRAVTGASTLTGLGAIVSTPAVVTASTGTTTVDRRLWIQESGGTFVPDVSRTPDTTEAAKLVGKTPGWTRTAAWTVTHQGVLPELANRWAEARLDGAGRWLALQVSSGTGLPSQVVKVWHPAFGVRATSGTSGAGDVVEIATASIDGCAAAFETRDVEPAPAQLDARIDALLAPVPEYPGGALLLGEEPAAPGEDPAVTAARQECFAKIGTSDTRVSVSIRARGLVLTSTAVGYAGRPVAGDPYALAYPAASGEDEDDLAALCPLVDWDGTFPPPLLACDEACRDTCERAVLARKARRVHNNFETCAVGDVACTDLYGTGTSPVFDGPVLAFQVGVQEKPAEALDWPVADTGATAVRDMSLAIGTTGGDVPIFPVVTGSPYLASGAIAFDRSTWSADAAYRFLVSYAADMVLDTSPHVSLPQVVIIR